MNQACAEKVRSINWTAHSWPLHVVLQVVWLGAKHDSLRKVGFLMWQLKAPSMTVLANKVITASSLMTQPWKHTVSFPLYSVGQSSPKTVQIPGEESSVQFSSVAQSCPTLCDPMNCSMPGLPVHHQLLEFTQTHVHQVGDAIQAISSSLIPFSSCPQSLPASGSFPMSQLFAWGGQSIGVSASASVLPMNTQDGSPLGWTLPICMEVVRLYWASLVAQLVKNLPAMQETPVRFLDWEVPLEKG